MDLKEGTHIQEQAIYTVKNLENCDWKIVGVCYVDEMITEKVSSAVSKLLIVLCLVMGAVFLLGWAFSELFSAPVRQLADDMHRFEKNAENFVFEPMAGTTEITTLSNSFEHMVVKIQKLMEQVRQEEITLRKTELKALQAQINPHFLYNTLNSIKWMATIQGATGISEMTTSLSRLLKSISKGTSLLIDIREELSLLENYFTIQSYRYGGTITMDIQVDNESLYNSEIIKFTLQPLVENAIFHGIEPKGCAGHIRIHVGYETSDNTEKIRIDVTDDGVGMTADKAAQVLRSNDDSSADFFREIGVSNVHKRLQYQFGAEYGITIESKEGEYTTMSIHIPNIPLHNNETVSSETISSENT